MTEDFRPKFFNDRVTVSKDSISVYDPDGNNAVRYSRDEWDVEVMLIPKFKPGYFMENRTSGIPAVRWFEHKPTYEEWVRVKVEADE